jgi:hypothetical protein
MHVYSNFFHSINLSVEKVYAKKKFDLLFPIEKKCQEKWNFEKNDFFENLNLGSDFQFQMPSRYGIYGTWSKKYPRFVTKIPIFTYSTRIHIDSTSNHSKSCRGAILSSNGHYFGEAEEIIPRWCFFPKKSIIALSISIKMASIIRLVWKFAIFYAKIL